MKVAGSGARPDPASPHRYPGPPFTLGGGDLLGAGRRPHRAPAPGPGLPRGAVDVGRGAYADRGPLGTDGRILGDDRRDLDRDGPGRMVPVPLLQRLRAVMSPWEVVARMSSSMVPLFLRALLTRP